MGKSRSRKPRNSATFRLCPRPGAADASDRVLVRVDGNPYYLPGFAAGEDEGYDGAVPSSSSDDYDGDLTRTYSAAGALPDHVRREILDLGLPDDGYNYLAHIREFRPSFSSTGGGGSSAAFIPSRRRPARSGLPLSVKAYDARSVEVGTDNVAAAAVVTTSQEAIDPDVTKLLEEGDVPQETSEDEESKEGGELEEDGVFEEDEELEEDFIIIANQPEEEEQMDLEDDFVILANQTEMLPLGAKAQNGFTGSSFCLV
ncbi:unnamed protein product [Alopecurus aequalis]